MSDPADLKNELHFWNDTSCAHFQSSNRYTTMNAYKYVHFLQIIPQNGNKIMKFANGPTQSRNS
jgi:hypothetical protein